MIAFNPSADFESITDGLSEFTIIRRIGDDTECNGLKRAVSTREAAASNGTIRQDDVAFHFATAVVGGPIRLGDTIREESPDWSTGEVLWTVMAVSNETLFNRVRCVCRNLVITENLETTVTIEVGDFSAATGGPSEVVWTTLHANLLARLQIEEANRESVHGRRVLKRKGTIFIRETIEVRAHHRIVAENGDIYRVTGFDQPERIGELFRIQVEQW